jgi:hypothetical protein
LGWLWHGLGRRERREASPCAFCPFFFFLFVVFLFLYLFFVPSLLISLLIIFFLSLLPLFSGCGLAWSGRRKRERRETAQKGKGQGGLCRAAATLSAAIEGFERCQMRMKIFKMRDV